MVILSKADSTAEPKKFQTLKNMNMTTITMSTKPSHFKMDYTQKMRKQTRKISLLKCRPLKIITNSDMKQMGISL
jgi:hypothetical protein